MVAGWLGLGLMVTGVALGQRSKVSAGTPVRDVRFHGGKAVTGLPGEKERGVGTCSSDGLSYFAGAAGTAAMDLYSLKGDGEVRHLRRKAPAEFGRVVSLDFYAGDEALVTLVEGDKLDERDAEGRPREVVYFLSTSDHDGDHADVVELRLRFRPLKVGVFGAGEYLVLGWDEGNRLPVLGVLRGDGMVKRFVDLGGKSAGAEAAELEALEGAKFVPFGRQVLLTYPGTTRAMRVVSAVGQDRVVSLKMPAGYVLGDMLTVGTGLMWVARVKEAGVKEGEKARVRLFEFEMTNGERRREFTFGDQGAEVVTCAAGSTLTGVYGAGEGKGLEVGMVRR